MDPLVILGVGALGVIILVFLSMLASVYQKCGPNQAMIVSGLMTKSGENEFKIIKGGGCPVLPLLQQRQFLSLEVMTIDVKQNAPIITKAGIPVIVEGVAQVKVRGDDESIATAAEQFLGKDETEIKAVAHETLMGHLRGIVGTMEVEELLQSIDGFTQKVQEHSIPDLKKMGLTIVSFTIKEIRDTVGYLEQLGRKKAAETKRDADIGEAIALRLTAEARAEAERAQAEAQAAAQRRIAVAQAEAARDQQIAQASAARDAKVAQALAAQEGATAQLDNEQKVAEAQRNLQIKQQEFAAEVSQKKAAADLAYEIVKAKQTQVLIEEQQKVKIVEAQKAVELESVEVQKREVMLEAEVTKPAEAEQQRTRINALAEQEKRTLLAQADADAAKMRAQADAESIKMKAQAEAEALRATGLAMAEATKAKGLAEASVIAAKGEAEAQAMVKKAEAYKLYNDAAIASMIIDKLPQIVESASAPLSKIGPVTLLSTSGDSLGGGRLTNEVINAAAQSLHLVKGLTGIDLAASLKRKQGVDGTADNKEGRISAPTTGNKPENSN